MGELKKKGKLKGKWEIKKKKKWLEEKRDNSG